MVGNAPAWLIVVAGIITFLDGFALFVGFGTQIAAIIGMVIALKHLVLSRRYDALQLLPSSTFFLLFLMCLCLLITGAGPYGFDLPL